MANCFFYISKVRTSHLAIDRQITASSTIFTDCAFRMVAPMMECLNLCQKIKRDGKDLQI
ncbi:MAG TPA: hypothetical protein DHV48_02970 [Prolixibacteraceae bacterium]|nr:hypothetical protein [Prolixibacteraceae bacterium]